MRILVTGASGFAGSLLAPRLLADGHSVRALGRDRERVRSALAGAHAQLEPAGIEIVEGDVVDGAGLQRALEGIEVAYYLIHSMERSTGADSTFAARDRVAAERFAAAAAGAGVRRIVYLGGLVPRQREHALTDRPSAEFVSRHLASREQVERILLDAVPDSLALRASIVIGARSRSFRLLVHLVERLPVLTLPAWHRFRTQPIDARDVTELLAASAAATPSRRSLDIGGPDLLSYGEMLGAIADLMLVSRPSLRLGMNLTPVAARVAAAIAGEDPELVVPLMESLQGDLIVSDDRAPRELGVKLHSFESAVEHALSDWETSEPLAAR
jgi:uncharacterized protein YbjT (DUF2867 family)